MSKKLKLSGQKFGRLTVIREAGKTKDKATLWECVCDCGNNIIVTGNSLKRGNTKSCGCLSKERHREAKLKHGMSGTRTYGVWHSMLQRCNNPNNTDYKDYGGRGIMVCEQWLDFANFFAVMGVKPDGLTIERINNEKGYFKENCRWATRLEQSRNMRIYKNNKTGISGVFFHKQKQEYHARIMVNGEQKHLGCFNNLTEAGWARDKAEKKYWKSHAENHTM